jgi:NADPH:quinone reductase-like Zn-dependent oxidoreductase
MPSKKKDTADQLTLRTMRAAAIDRFGGPEVLSIHNLPVPVPEAGEVLIALHTVGAASWDADIRAGWFPSGRPHFPLVLGTDGAGTIAAVGSRIRRFQKGIASMPTASSTRKGVSTLSMSLSRQKTSRQYLSQSTWNMPEQYRPLGLLQSKLR